MNKEVILTGLRSNDQFHLGNYLGAILPMVELQKKYAGKSRIHMFVPDLHSFTTPVEHTKLYKQSIENLKVYVAAGLNLDEPDTYIYRQSFIPAHSELAWILSCFTYMGELSRMTQYKEKADNNSSVGLFIYPVLMAADILLYDATYVPVGEDQRQHLELARDLAERFNNKFSKVFTPPHQWDKQLEFASRQSAVRIRSLRNPEKKMSKSINDPAGTILLTDEAGIASEKIMGATTDSLKSINLDWDKQPGISNLLQILALLTNRPLKDVVDSWKSKAAYTDLKKAVSDEVSKLLKDIQSNVKTVDEEELLKKLSANENEISKVANNKLESIQKAVGLRP